MKMVFENSPPKCDEITRAVDGGGCGVACQASSLKSQVIVTPHDTKKELNLLNTFQFQSTISSLLIVSVDDDVVPLFRFVKQSSSSVITTLFVIS